MFTSHLPRRLVHTGARDGVVNTLMAEVLVRNYRSMVLEP